MQESSWVSIHPDTHIGLVTLRVANLERSLHFYEDILGFQRAKQTSASVTLGDENGTPLLQLNELPGAAPQPTHATGLYHVAILMPDRAALGRVLVRMIEAGIEIGQGDHLVSEALYISDPDRNGLEIYQDRPRETWQWENGAIKMASDPVDIRSLVAEGKRDGEQARVLPAGTRVGHIHLQVGDIPQAEHFYHTILGFDITTHWPSALFISAGGYHHHIGLNTWQSLGAAPTPTTAAGLETFIIALPTRVALEQVRERLTAHVVPFEQPDEDTIIVPDPWHNQIKLSVEL